MVASRCSHDPPYCRGIEQRRHTFAYPQHYLRIFKCIWVYAKLFCIYTHFRIHITICIYANVFKYTQIVLHIRTCSGTDLHAQHIARCRECGVAGALGLFEVRPAPTSIHIDRTPKISDVRLLHSHRVVAGGTLIRRRTRRRPCGSPP